MTGRARVNRVPVAVDIARKGCEAYGGCLDRDQCVKQGYCTRVEDARKEAAR